MPRLGLGLLVLAPLVVPSVAAAVWSGSGSGSAGIGADIMDNASAFTAKCSTSKSNSSVTLAWTISPDTYVEGYEIVRTGAGGGTNAVIQVSRTTSSHVDSPPTTSGASYTYTIRSGSTKIAWTTPLLKAAGTPTYSKTACTTA